ncbi:MAG TPA: AAA-like domain-containing protein [Vicinamibacterales bacterium]|nr:AAA-like domain-containing protein [Vicinamibacterales bacterium]
MLHTSPPPASDVRAPDFFVTGGALASDAPSYVVRDADAELLEALIAGEFCYVLTARQMGKSSLMVRTVAELRKNGIDAAVVDLTAIGLHVTVEQWYRGLLTEVGEQLGMESAVDAAWSALRDLPPTQRWLKVLRDLLVIPRPRPLAIFVDEIDVVRSLPFRTDDFFAGIREIFNRRARQPAMRRLSFCLLGVAAPTDLIADPTLTPFNIGRRIELADFTPTEAVVLAAGLGRPPDAARALLARIGYWTGAHPYLTQRLCLAIARDPSVRNDADVDRCCQQLFLSPHAAERDDNLIFVREHLLTQDALRTPLLDLYASVLRGDGRGGDDRVNPVVSALRLSGIVRADGDRLRVRNEIYARVFDRAWVARHLPDAEVRRQRAAFRRGALRTGIAAAVVLAAVLGGVAALWRQHGQLRAEQDRSRGLLYAAEMNLAAQAWNASGAGRTRALLEHHVPAAGERDLRGFEWRYLWRLTHGDQPPLRGRVEDPTRVAFAPDGARLAVAGWRGLLDVWDLASRRLLFTVGDAQHGGQTAVTFSPDGRMLVAGGALDWVRVYDAAGGTLLQELRGHTDRLRDVAFSPDGRLLATAGFDRTIRLWDTASWRLLSTLTGHTRGVNAVRFTDDGTQLVSGSWDNTVRLWDVHQRREIAQLPHDGDVETLALTGNGRTLVTGGWEQALKIWDTASRRVLATLAGHTTVVSHLAASPDGRTIVSASSDGTVRLWDLGRRREVSRVRTGGQRYLAIGLSPDGRRLVTAGDQGELRVWPVEGPGRVDQDAAVLEGHTDVVTGLVFTPDDRRLISTSYDGTVRIWDWRARQAAATLTQGGRIGLAPSLSSDGRLIAVKDDERGVVVWDVVAARETRALPSTPALTGAVFTPDGRLVACGNFNLVLWDVTRETPLSRLETSVNVGPNLAMSPDGRTLISGNRQGEVTFWSISPFAPMAATAPHTDYVSAFDFSPDGRTMLTASFDGVIRLWDMRTRTPRAELRGHQGWVTSAVFSPDGRRIASGGADGVIKFWDVETGHELMTLFGHRDRIHALAFAHDGQVLASGSADRTIRLWRAAASMPSR